MNQQDQQQDGNKTPTTSIAMNQVTRQGCSAQSNSAFTPKFSKNNQQNASEASKAQQNQRFSQAAEQNIVRQASIMDQQ